ncbi:hypothetical protein niasHT_004539 [Heterodera trifolii]|uniref:B30.2/SPRY domain-containing protein n=1 Tax=Heterodera trifolii TaxID=157864 RepID=A0ABD2M079_9BILA
MDKLEEQLDKKEEQLKKKEDQLEKKEDQLEKKQKQHMDKLEEQLDKKEEQLEKKEKRLEKKEDQLEKKEDQLEKKQKQHMDKLEEQLDKKEEQLKKKEDQLEKKQKQHMDKLEEQLDKKEEQLEKKEKRLEKMEEQLEQLQKNVLQVKCDSEAENNVKLKNEQKEMKENVDKLEEKLGRKLDEQKAFQEEHEEKLMEQIETLQAKISKMEMEHQKQKVYIGQMEQLQNEQKKKDQCIGKESAENGEYRTVFATHPILLGKNSSEIFYFEIPNPYCGLTFGFAIKQQDKLKGAIANDFGTYAYLTGGDFTVNGEWKIQKEDYSVGREDTVGCGINLATRQIFFTKNGWLLASYDLVDHSPYFDVPDELFPFLSLLCSGEEIEANFGPKFAFDLAKPKQWKKAIISSN